MRFKTLRGVHVAISLCVWKGRLQVSGYNFDTKLIRVSFSFPYFGFFFPGVVLHSATYLCQMSSSSSYNKPKHPEHNFLLFFFTGTVHGELIVFVFGRVQVSLLLNFSQQPKFRITSHVSHLPCTPCVKLPVIHVSYYQSCVKSPGMSKYQSCVSCHVGYSVKLPVMSLPSMCQNYQSCVILPRMCQTTRYDITITSHLSHNQVSVRSPSMSYYCQSHVTSTGTFHTTKVCVKLPLMCHITR